MLLPFVPVVLASCLKVKNNKVHNGSTSERVEAPAKPHTTKSTSENAVKNCSKFTVQLKSFPIPAHKERKNRKNLCNSLLFIRLSTYLSTELTTKSSLPSLHESHLILDLFVEQFCNCIKTSHVQVFVHKRKSPCPLRRKLP